MRTCAAESQRFSPTLLGDERIGLENCQLTQGLRCVNKICPRRLSHRSRQGCGENVYSEKAQFKDFNPFWEFVSAGSFGPNVLDNTFGPEVIFQSFPPAANLSPFAGLQFFGQVDIGGSQAEMRVSLKETSPEQLFSHRGLGRMDAYTLRVNDRAASE